MTEKSIHVRNTRISYKTAGTGVPVVLVHGFAEDSDVWKYQQEQLSAYCHLIIPDLPGCGQSGLTDNLSMEAMADVLKQIIDQELAPLQAPGQSIPAVVMIGHSMGGYITLAFAEKYPDQLRAFGLFHSGAYADNDEKKATRRRGIAFIQTHGSYEFIKQSAPNLFTETTRIKNTAMVAEMIARYGNFDPLALAGFYEAMIQRPDRTAVLTSFGKPILFVIGKEDKAIPFEDSMKQCHLPSLASIQILENAAHMGMWEEPAKSTQTLLHFLQEAAV